MRMWICRYVYVLLVTDPSGSGRIHPKGFLNKLSELCKKIKKKSSVHWELVSIFEFLN